jgi:hypothetical protein
METKCQRCGHRTSAVSAIIKSTYYSRLCHPCHADLMAGQSVSSGAAVYNRQRDVEDNLAAIVQPYVGGLPNPDFIKAYPEKALEMFGVEAIRRHS